MARKVTIILFVKFLAIPKASTRSSGREMTILSILKSNINCDLVRVTMSKRDPTCDAVLIADPL